MERDLTFEEVSEMALAILNDQPVMQGFPVQEARLREQISEIASKGLTVSGFD